MIRSAMCVMALVVCASLAHAGDTLWGVTNGANDDGFWTGGDIFTVDVATGTVDVKATYTGGAVLAFGDIAVNSIGEVFVTYYSSATGNFKTLAKVNTTTWGFDWTQTLAEQVNALTFIGDTLYAAAGGGSVDNLYRFDTLDGTTAPTVVGPSGYLGSDGDLFYDSDASKLYNVYTPNSTGNLVEVDPSTGVGTVIGTLNGDAKFGTTAGGFNYGWAGMEFDSSGKLWAGTYWDQNLYSRPDLLAGSDVVVEYDLSGALGGNITGLSRQVTGEVIPAPAAILAGPVLLGLIGLRRKRRA